MSFKPDFSKKFSIGLSKIEKGEPSRIHQIQLIIKKILDNPFDKSLHLKKLQGRKNAYVCKIGIKYRLEMEIIIKEEVVRFIKIDRRENFY